MKLLLVVSTFSVGPLLGVFASAVPRLDGRDHGNGHGSVPTVTIDRGVVQGVSTSIPGSSQPVSKFLGIPFAAPPIRFAPPEKPAPWGKSPFNANQYGPACIQEFAYPAASRALVMEWFNTPPPPAGESEDCLNLNVYTPAQWGNSNGGGKAVMVWIYGGSLQFGANSLAEYDGSYFAAFQDVIVVTINYRTNVFGFPGSPEQGLNLGFLDQRLALDWVQRNIAAFGGDPQKVTIFGESAGSASVDALVTSFPQNAPFRAAIEESGQATYRAANPNPHAPWNALAAAVGCNASTSSTLECLRAIPAATVKDTIEKLALPFTAIIDNVTLVANAAAARAAGNIAKVPLLAGTNADEGSLFTYGQTNLTAYLDATFPTAPQSFKDLISSSYPIGSPGITNSSQQIAKIATEYVFQCSQAKQVHANEAAGIPTWRYFFNTSFDHLTLFPGAGVFHSSEIALVFGTYRIAPGWTPFEQSLSAYMQAIWAGFAKNPYAGPGWAQDPTVADLGGNGVFETDIPSSSIDQRCALFDPLYQ